jgi:hypothetical protein
MSNPPRTGPVPGLPPRPRGPAPPPPKNPHPASPKKP